MNKLSVDNMNWCGGSDSNYGGAIACGAAAALVVVGIVAAGMSAGSAGLFLGSFIVSNAAMAWTCITAA